MKKSLLMISFALIFKYYISILGFCLSNSSINVWHSPNEWMLKAIELGDYPAIILFTGFNILSVISLILAIYQWGSYVLCFRRK